MCMDKTDKRIKVLRESSLSTRLTVGKWYDVYYDENECSKYIKDDRGSRRFDIIHILNSFEEG